MLIALACALVAATVATSSVDTLAPRMIVSRIEAQDVVELGPVSFDGHLGKSSVELIALEALGDDALPALLAMSSSKSPVARVVAAAGLQQRTEPIARVVLSRLAQDDAKVRVRRGCLGSETSVGDAVRDLIAYHVLIRPR